MTTLSIGSQQHMQVLGSRWRAVLPPGCWMMDEQETRWRRSARCFNFGCSAQRRRSRKLLRSDSWRQQLGSSSSVLCEAFGSFVSRCDVAEGKTATHSFTLDVRRRGRCLDRKSDWRCDIVNYVAVARHHRTRASLWTGDTSTRMSVV